MDSLIGHCAVNSNNLDSRFIKLSAIDVIAQAILERLYLVSGLSQFAPRGNVPMYPDPHRTITGYFSILVKFFLVNTIHQVIWPSPGTISTQHFEPECSFKGEGAGGSRWPLGSDCSPARLLPLHPAKFVGRVFLHPAGAYFHPRMCVCATFLLVANATAVACG